MGFKIKKGSSFVTDNDKLCYLKNSLHILLVKRLLLKTFKNESTTQLFVI